MTPHMQTNGTRPDGIEFRTLWLLSTAHITKENADGKLGPSHKEGEWPVRSQEDGVINLYISEDPDVELDPHLQAIFQYARENGVVELRFDEDGPICDKFPSGGAEFGFLDPDSPETRTSPKI